MGFLRLLLFAVAGGIVMILCLLWISQFFTGGGEYTPVIWLEEEGTERRPEEESFAEWE